MIDNMFDGADSTEKQWATREQIAAHFQFSVRTIGNLMRRRILPYAKTGNLVRFSVTDCDQAWEQFKSPGLRGRAPLPATRARNWMTKAQIAEHFACSMRTIGKLMLKKILPHTRLGNLVRFELAECDEAMEQLKVPSMALRARGSSMKTKGEDSAAARLQ